MFNNDNINLLFTFISVILALLTFFFRDKVHIIIKQKIILFKERFSKFPLGKKILSCVAILLIIFVIYFFPSFNLEPKVQKSLNDNNKVTYIEKLTDSRRIDSIFINNMLIEGVTPNYSFGEGYLTPKGTFIKILNKIEFEAYQYETGQEIEIPLQLVGDFIKGNAMIMISYISPYDANAADFSIREIFPFKNNNPQSPFAFPFIKAPMISNNYNILIDIFIENDTLKYKLSDTLKVYVG